MTEWLNDPQIWASLLTLTIMEIVLGIDNIIFISVIVSRLKEKYRDVARQIGLGLALIFRIILLFYVAWIITLREPVLTVFDHALSWRDIILIAGGLFLLAKATLEIHKEIEEAGEKKRNLGSDLFMMAILQIIIIDIVFSVDSIITAVGMADHVEVMIAAVIIAMAVMYLAAGAISRFIENHPTTKMLALAFLFLVGAALVADGLHFHIPRGYIYFAMSFAAAVELINIFARRNKKRA